MDECDDIELQLLSHKGGDEEPMPEELMPDGPSSGLTPTAPRFREDLEAILHLTKGGQPQVQTVRSKLTMTAYYGFGDASSGGFGATVERPGGIHGRFGLCVKDDKDQSSNYREICNLVDTVEEEANEGHLRNGELWLFTDNSTAESCFFRGGFPSKLLHKLVLGLRKAEM